MSDEMISNYTYSNTNYLYNGCDIVTLTHNSTGTKLSLSKVSKEVDLLEIFTRFLEETAMNQRNTFVYNPESQRAFVVEFRVQDWAGSAAKPGFSFLCLGSKKQTLTPTKDLICIETRSADQITLVKIQSNRILAFPEFEESLKFYPISQKQDQDRIVQEETINRCDILSHNRFISISSETPALADPVFSDFIVNVLSGETDVYKDLISQETLQKIELLLHKRIEELIAFPKSAAYQATGSPG